MQKSILLRRCIFVGIRSHYGQRILPVLGKLKRVGGKIEKSSCISRYPTNEMDVRMPSTVKVELQGQPNVGFSGNLCLLFALLSAQTFIDASMAD